MGDDDNAAGRDAGTAAARQTLFSSLLGHDLDHCTAWTLRVTRNLAIDNLRQRARERQLGDHDVAVVDTNSELELRLMVLDAVRDLPERQRRAMPRKERAPMKFTSIEQATGSIGTDQPVSARITGRIDGGFTADIGVPAVYYPRGQQRPRWGPDHPDTLIGTEFDCVVLDIDDQQRAVITDALTGEAAAVFRRRQEQVRNLQVGQRRTGQVAAVLPFGALVDFDDLRGLVPNSQLDPSAPLFAGQEVEVEIITTNIQFARVGLRVVTP